MKNKITLPILIFATFVSFYVLSDKPKESMIQVGQLEDGSTLITYDTSRFIINIDKNHESISVDLGVNEGVTLGVTDKNSIKSILVNKINKNGETQYIRDINADGIPDTRVTHKKNQTIIGDFFFKGQFYERVHNPDGDDYILVDGEKVGVKYFLESIANQVE